MEFEARALIDGARGAVHRVIADLRQKAEAAEQLRSAEHRAFMAEQREALALLKRAVEDRIAGVRDGLDGKDGLVGERGEQGFVGPQGERGEPGEAGPVGAIGQQGPQGEHGAIGPAGERGEKGSAGEPGADGAVGPAGIQGEQGAAGLQGEKGEPGADGAVGVRGEKGEPGERGPQGDAGPQGETGARGDFGEVGVPGRDGLDAYPGEARGLFDPGATYRALDAVSFNGSEWRAKFDNPGVLPGDGWMLSASRGKRGDRGEKGDAGRDAKGKYGASIIAGFVDTKDMELTLTRDDGQELKVDLYPLANVIRSA